MAVERYRDKPLVSIVMCCFNASKFLHQAVSSVARQTHTNVELIFYDDASSDDSIKVMKKQVKKFSLDKRTKMFYHKTNLGYGATLRDAIAQCTGEFICILDADDALLPKAIELSVKLHVSRPDVSMTHSNRWFCDEKLRRLRCSKDAQFPKGKTLLELKNSHKCSHFKMFKKVMYDKTEGVDPTLWKSVDKDLSMKLEEVGKVIFINDILYMYRLHGDSISKRYKKLTGADKKKIDMDKKRMYFNACKRRKLIPKDMTLDQYEDKSIRYI
jgi:glycosyltransferase involved in cell wall biosynthesis